MTTRQPSYTPEEHARLGAEIYALQVRSLVEVGNQGKVVAIDVDSSDYELAENSLLASTQLLARRPDAQIWCLRIGYPAVYRFGVLPAKRA